MFALHPFHPKKTVPFAEGTLRVDEDKKRFNIRDQNEILQDFLKEHKEAVEELVDGDLDDINPVTKIFFSGRVRIAVPILPKAYVPDMTCEECEKNLAVAKCEACNEVFCEKCLDLCHEKNWMLNVLHEHYLSKSIRELIVGDTSKIDTTVKYVLPQYECYDTDQDLLRNKDISAPYSLTVPANLVHHKMTTPLVKPKYNVGDTVVYLDFQSETPDVPVFGIVISEWDFRHGDSAPTITRGPDSVLWYVIRRLDEALYCDPYAETTTGEVLGSVAAAEDDVDGAASVQSYGAASGVISVVSDTSALTGLSTTAESKHGCISEDNIDVGPLIEGLQDMPLRKALAKAKEVNKRATLAKQIQTFGSKLHFSSLFTSKNRGVSSIGSSSMDAADDISMLSRDSHSLYGQSQTDETGLLSNHQLHMRVARPMADMVAKTLDTQSMSMMSDVIGNNTGPRRLKNVSDTYILVAGLEAKGVDTLTKNGKLLPASKRSYYHIYEETDERFSALDRSGSWDWRSMSKAEESSTNAMLAADMLKIIVMPENEVYDPEAYFKKILNQKQQQFKGIVKKAFVKIFAAQMLNAFENWVDLVNEQIFEEETYAAILFQTAARRWLCRNVISDIRANIADSLEQRRALLHTSFKYSLTGPGPSAKTADPSAKMCYQPPLFTLDNKRFFDTRRDLNRYALHLRVEISKVIYFLNLRRNGILKEAIGRWKAMLHSAFLESDLKSGHILAYNDDTEKVNKNHGFDEARTKWREQISAEMSLEEYRNGVIKIHTQLNRSFSAQMETKALTHWDPSALPSAHLGRGAMDSYNHILAVPLALPHFNDTTDEYGDGGYDVIHSPFHPTIALRARPKDLTTGCAGGYSTTREGELIFSNNDHGVSSASKQTHCITIDTSFSTKTAIGSVSRLGRDGTIDRINPKDNKLASIQTADAGRLLIKGRQNVNGMAANESPGSHSLSVLPPLPVIPASLTKDGNLDITAENRPKYNSLRSRLEGPTEYSVWIIPGILAMGTVPVGRAWRRRQVKTSVHTCVDAASQLVLSGISTFVSLIPVEDEAIAEKRCPISLDLDPERGGFGVHASRADPGKAVETCFKHIVKDSRYQLNAVISGLKSQIENWNADIQLNTIDDPKNMRYEESIKEDLRLRARRSIAVQCNDLAKQELAQLWDPKHVKSEFIRFPIEQDSAPDLNDFLPLIWKLEERLMAGERLYVYSLEGHGRCGLVCGSLLGRLYGLTPRETLFRMQIHHDCIASQVRRLVPVNCPQMINQQDLLSLVLNNTNRVFDGVTLRSQLDPETFVSELHHLERGSQIGVYGVSVTEFVEKRTVPTIYHEPGGRSKHTWADNGEQVFDHVAEDVLTSAGAGPKLSRRSTRASNGGYSKKGLSLRNSRSSEENGTVPSLRSTPPAGPFMSNIDLSIKKPPSRKQSRRTPKKSKRRATTGEISSSSDNESGKEEILSSKEVLHHTPPAYAPRILPSQISGGGTAAPALTDANRASKAANTVPFKVKTLRPTPAEAPKLPSIRSRYGDIA